MTRPGNKVVITHNLFLHRTSQCKKYLQLSNNTIVILKNTMLLFLLITFCKFTTNQDARRVRLIDSLIVFKTNILQVSPVKLPVKLQRHFFTHVDPYVAVPFLCAREKHTTCSKHLFECGFLRASSFFGIRHLSHVTAS